MVKTKEESPETPAGSQEPVEQRQRKEPVTRMDLRVSQDRATQLKYFAMLPLNKPGQREQVMEALNIDAREVSGLLRPLPRLLDQESARPDPSGLE